MTAKDDYPLLAAFAFGSSGRDDHLIAKRREAARALAEIERLRDYRRWVHELDEAAVRREGLA